MDQHLAGEKRGRVGTWLGRTWRVERQLGRGGMATVYAATHIRNGLRVAVKVLHPDASRDAETVARFKREGYLANAVGHAGAVRVYDDLITSDGCALLIMELCEGETLQARCDAQCGVVAVGRALAVTREVLAILAAAHAKGIVHRDVKPANVFLLRDGTVKLLDFGLASMARSTSSTSQTRTGIGWGTPDFMAPEQMSGARPHGPAVDVWAVGVMVFRLVTGRSPFETGTLAGFDSSRRSKPPMLDTLVPGFPVAVARVIDRALSYEPEARWADAGAMARAVDEAERAALATTCVDALPIETTVAISTLPRFSVDPHRGVVSVTLDGPAPRTSAPPPPPCSPPTLRSSEYPPPAPALPRTSMPTMSTRGAFFDRRGVVIGFLALSIAAFLGSAAYSLHSLSVPSSIAIEK